MPYRIALADDQDPVLAFVHEALAGIGDLEIVAETHDGAELLEFLRTAPEVPELIITDISMPAVGGIEVTRQAMILYPATKVLILSMHEEEEYLTQAMSAGASGYLLKDDTAEELISAIRLIQAGGKYISRHFRLRS